MAEIMDKHLWKCVCIGQLRVDTNNVCVFSNLPCLEKQAGNDYIWNDADKHPIIIHIELQKYISSYIYLENLDPVEVQSLEDGCIVAG